MQSWEWEEKTKLGGGKKDIQSENNWAEQASRGGSCAAEGSDKPESQRSDDETGPCNDCRFPGPKGRGESSPPGPPHRSSHLQKAARQTPQLSGSAPATAYSCIHLEKLSFLPRQ